MTIIYDNNPFPGMPQNDENCWRFTDKDQQECERILFSNWWRELINKYGIEVSYFVNTYNLLSGDNLYGEEPTKVFADPRNIIMVVELNDNAITLSKFGFLSEDEITAYVHISSFETTFETLSTVYEGQNNLIEPKAGDVFQLSEFGDDRPNSRQPKYFEITERLDEDVSVMNQLGGHYVWLIKAKRLDYSFEPGIPFNSITENISGNQQVYEDGETGVLSGGASTETDGKKPLYDEYDIDDVSKDDVFDMDQNDTDVYGDY